MSWDPQLDGETAATSVLVEVAVVLLVILVVFSQLLKCDGCGHHPCVVAYFLISRFIAPPPLWQLKRAVSSTFFHEQGNDLSIA